MVSPPSRIAGPRATRKEIGKARLHAKQVYTWFLDPLWTHESRPICFSLVVDDFGVKYVGKDNAKHLIKVLEEHYDLSKDWHGTKYCGLSLDWDYKKREIHLSMPGYVEKAFARFKHSKARKVQDQPHKHAIPLYK